MNAQVLALVNQKGGVTKTSSCVNLAAGLAQAGKKVAVVDVDPQASLTISLGNPQPDRLPVTLSDNRTDSVKRNLPWRQACGPAAGGFLRHKI